MRSGDLVDMVGIRDIVADDIDPVYWFIVREEGEAMIASDRRFVEALIRNGELRETAGSPGCVQKKKQAETPTS